MQTPRLNDAPGQPAALRWALYANILLWGVQLPFGMPALNVLATLVAAFMVQVQYRRVPMSLILFSLCLIGYGVIVFFAGPCTDGGIKMITSIVVLSLLLVSIYWLASSARRDLPLLRIREACALLAIITCAALIEYVIKLAGGAALAELRVGGVYLEPSHLALSGTPLFCYVFICGDKVEKAGALLAAALLLVVGYSSTMLVLLLVGFALPYLGRIVRRPLRRSWLLIVAALITVPVLVVLVSNSQDTLLRVNDVVDLRQESNLSSLVYANGWMLLDHYLNATSGFGLGFNAMGCEPRAVTVVTGWLTLLDLADQNYNDGSFLLSKVGSEFGIPGLLAFGLMVLVSLKRLFGLLKDEPDPTAVICINWIAIVFIGGLVRSGGGYFNGPVLLGILAFFLLRSRRQPAGTARAQKRKAGVPLAPAPTLE
jgi:hypothetical protein